MSHVQSSHSYSKKVFIFKEGQILLTNRIIKRKCHAPRQRRHGNEKKGIAENAFLKLRESTKTNYETEKG